MINIIINLLYMYLILCTFIGGRKAFNMLAYYSNVADIPRGDLEYFERPNCSISWLFFPAKILYKIIMLIHYILCFLF